MHDGINENKNEWTDLLVENSPKPNWNYLEEASILNKNINDPAVHNIAVLARYGAGKSSAINTYLELYHSDKRNIDSTIMSLNCASKYVEMMEDIIGEWRNRLNEDIKKYLAFTENDDDRETHSRDENDISIVDYTFIKTLLCETEAELKNVNMCFDSIEELLVVICVDIESAEDFFDSLRKKTEYGKNFKIAMMNENDGKKGIDICSFFCLTASYEEYEDVRKSCERILDDVCKLGNELSEVEQYFDLISDDRKKTCRNRRISFDGERDYAKISLASFNGDEHGGYAESSDETVERGILQQLFYSRKKKYFPNSTIKRTSKTPWYLRLFPLILVIFIAATVLFSLAVADVGPFLREYGNTGSMMDESAETNSMFMSDEEENLSQTDLSSTDKDNAAAGSDVGESIGKRVFEWTCFAISVVSLFWVVADIAKYAKVRSIKIKDFEIALDKNGNREDDSLISKFVDEIIYFFDCVNVNLVIFEDLDRWGSTRIFSKLRELNTIVNLSFSNRKVTFLYAVKSDMFKNEEERAKFFDYILYITPVVNPTATKYMLLRYNESLILSDGDIRKLSHDFIEDISVYITDMRILNNVFDDYVAMSKKIFKNENGDGTLKSDNLFAICLYKNLFPQDYELLENDNGLLYNAMSDSWDFDRVISEMNEVEMSNLSTGSVRLYLYDDTKRERNITDCQMWFINFLKTHGYIDDNYKEYIFENKSKLSIKDHELLLMVKSGKEIEFDSEIDDSKRFVSELTEKDLGRESVMIKPVIDELCCIGSADPDNRIYKEFEQFYSADKRNEESIRRIIQRYIEFDTHHKPGGFISFFSQMSGCCLDLFIDVIVDYGRSFTDSSKRKNLNEIIAVALKYYCGRVKNLGQCKPSLRILMYYIAEREDYMELLKSAGDHERVERLIAFVSPVFKHLDKRYRSNNDPLQGYIISRLYYEINVSNLEIVLDINTSDKKCGFYTDNYNYIMSESDEHLKQHVNKNMDSYIKNVWPSKKVVCDEDGVRAAVIDFIKSEHIKIQRKESIIREYCNRGRKFDCLDGFDSRLYGVLLDYDGMVATWTNIVIVYNECKYKKTIKYLKEHVRNPKGDIVSDYDGYNNLISEMIKYGEDYLNDIINDLPYPLFINKLIDRDCLKQRTWTREYIKELIAAEKTSYSRNDYSLICDDEEMLFGYISCHYMDIDNDFDGFFGEYKDELRANSKVKGNSGFPAVDMEEKAGQEIERSEILRKLADFVDYKGEKRELDGIKRKIIDLTWDEIKNKEDAARAMIYGYENKYANYIIKSGNPVPSDLLWQFTNWRNDEENDAETEAKKFSILVICGFGSGNNTEGSGVHGAEYVYNLKAFLKNCATPYKYIFDDTYREIKLETTDYNRKLVNVLAENGLIAFTEDETRKEFNVKACLEDDGDYF